MKTPTLAAAVTAALVLTATAPVRASLIFDFSFSGVTNSGTGTVTGEIDLPNNAINTTTQATHVVIDTIPASMTFPSMLPHDTINDNPTINTFTVDSLGDIVDFHYTAGVSYVFCLNATATSCPHAPAGSNLLGLTIGQGGSVFNGSGLSGVTLTPVTAAVPEPASLALLAVGLAGVGMARRLRRA